jgi:hypothetical protein
MNHKGACHYAIRMSNSKYLGVSMWCACGKGLAWKEGRNKDTVAVTVITYWS